MKTLYYICMHLYQYIMNVDYMRPVKGRFSIEVEKKIVWKENLSIRQYQNVVLSYLGQLMRPFPEDSGELIVDDIDICYSVNPCRDEKMLDGTTLFGGSLIHIWGHFLLGSMARLWPFVNPEFVESVDHICFFASPKFKLTKNFLQLFEILGIADKIMIVDSNVSIKNLAVPDLAYEHDAFVTHEMRALFSYIVDKSLAGKCCEKSAKRKLFLSRSALPESLKKEINLINIENIFRDSGYEIIHPQNLSINQLISLFSESEEIVSISGSLAHNFVFSNPNIVKKYTIIERHADINDFQISLDKMMEINSVRVDAFFMPRLFNSSDDVYLYGLTSCFANYIKDSNLLNKSLDDSDRKKQKELRRFFNLMSKYFCHAEPVCDFEICQGESLVEALCDSNQYYSKWLREFYPLTTTDWLNPKKILRYYVKKRRGHSI